MINGEIDETKLLLQHETHTHTQVNELCDNDRLVQEGNIENK